MKRVLILCNANATREHIKNIVKEIGYNVIKIVDTDTIKSLESLRKSGVADLVIIGQHANADIIIQWIERCCSIPIIFIGGCECESKKIAHHTYEIDKSALENELPALLGRLIGPAKPLK